MSQIVCTIRRLLLPSAIAAACVLTCAIPAHAAESVALANGFNMRCDHHAIVDGQVRLYAHADETDFLDLAPSQVIGFRELPAQPAPVPASAAGSPSAAPTTTHAMLGTEQQVPGKRVPGKRDMEPLGREQLQPLLASAGREHDLDVDLLASIVQAESANHPRAVSHAGAEGLMQLMPATAQTLGVRDVFAPDENVHGGAAYLDGLLTRYHENLALALAAYNAGPAAVDRYHDIPPYRETRLYVARVIHLFNQRVAQRNRRTAQAALYRPQ